ncbi:MAG TPA: hypothetical protein VFP89_13610 [Propionibacteriaceae bacterium]|nr:hypothetical protein [Propionibacteriaceae bacterium]
MSRRSTHLGSGRGTDMSRPAPRRERLAYLALLRRVSHYTRRAAGWRIAAVLIVLGASCLSDRVWWALPLIGVAGISQPLSWLHTLNEPRWVDRVPLLVRYLAHVERLSGHHKVILPAYLDLLGSVGLVVTASWLLTDVPVWTRLAALAAAVGVWVSTALGFLTDHAWFNPAELAPRWHEWLRPIAGPLSVLIVAALVLPAPWAPDSRLAALMVCTFPLVITVRVAETDLTLCYLADLVREQAHEGRELVLRETHGALSTQLRLIVQYARSHRSELPDLYDLAVSADSRLRETLALSDIGRETSLTVDALAAPVMTLGRAVGASTTVQIAVDHLSPANHELARLVLADLVGNALNAGAARVAVRLQAADGIVSVAVDDDAHPMPAGVWRSVGTSSARLADRLGELGGSLEVQSGERSKTVTGFWNAAECDARAS